MRPQFSIAVRPLALLNQARPTEKALGHARGFIKVELVQVQDVKCETELVANFLLGNHRRSRIVRLTRVAGQDQPAGACGQMPRHGWGVLCRRGPSHRMVATTVEKEVEGAIQVGQLLQHIGG
jgi:hypothetical protein